MLTYWHQKFNRTLTKSNGRLAAETEQDLMGAFQEGYTVKHCGPISPTSVRLTDG